MIVIIEMRDDKDYVRVLLYSYYTTITGWLVLLKGSRRALQRREAELFLAAPDRA